MAAAVQFTASAHWTSPLEGTGMHASGNVPTTSLIGGPTPATARQGRHKQRYGETGERLVAGCIPIRYPGAAPAADTTEVMLITSRGGGWVFPKGGWEDDETLEAAARRETVEEAGVRGSIEEPLVGTFPFASSKQSHSNNAHQGRCLAHMFVMRVAEELDTWPEWPQRRRCWVPLAEAGGQLRHQWMRDALQAWIDRSGWKQLIPPVPRVAAASVVVAAAGSTAAVAAAADGGGATEQQQQQQLQLQQLSTSDSGSISSA